MSEYQYHEWQTLERPLTAAEHKAVNELSSHINVTSTRASVSYNWSRFRHDPINVLAKYFDAYLYFANWGTRCLAFRFPNELVDVVAIEAYCDEYHTNIKTFCDAQILEFNMGEEEGFDEWIDERRLLSTLARLRDDILQRDYRSLYFAWLKAMTLETGGYDEDEDDPDNFFNDPEPALPAGLKQLTPPLNAFIEFFEIDPFLVAAAAELSPSLPSTQQTDFAPPISRLTRQECDEFLLKIVNTEPGAVAELRNKLSLFEKPKPNIQSNSRTFGDLLRTAEKLRQDELNRRAEERRKKHVAEMQELAKREAKSCQDVENLIQSGYAASNYDEATSLLVKFQQLAEFQGTQSNFDIWLQALEDEYKGRSALIGRWKKKGWV